MSSVQSMAVGALYEAVKNATNAYAAAKIDLSIASAAETRALNELNKAQKDFDEVVKKIKADAHPVSDWGREAREKSRRDSE